MPLNQYLDTMAYYNNVSTLSTKEFSDKIEEFFTEWALRNDFAPQINALMRNYDYCVERNNKGSPMKLYNLMIIKHEVSLPSTENFKSFVNETTKELSGKLEKFMKEWGKTNGYIVQIEALIADYNKCLKANLKKKEDEEEKESEKRRLQIIRHIVRIQLGTSDIKWFCIPQKCETENDQLVCLEENPWKPISLDEVNLILLGPEDLIADAITDEAKERGVKIPECTGEQIFVFTGRSRYPYVVNGGLGGLLFCRKWVSSNVVAAQKIVLSEIPGDTCVIIGEGDRAVTLNRIIAMYKVLDDNKAELHLYDETGGKHILNFNVEHDKHSEHEARQIPDENMIINYCVVKFVHGLINSQMIMSGNGTVIITVNDGRRNRDLTISPREFDHKDNKLYLGEKEMFNRYPSSEDATDTFIF
ncbi:Hypothetical protein HVR_LOCUS344 [uncultured virus]|nr:Hypothetical protein HVR_LOCUS344 [uncultured virus]